MPSYIEKIEILRDIDRAGLQKRIDEFSVGKCIKKIQVYNHTSKTFIVDKYSAYVYYTLPDYPVFNVTVTPDLNTLIIEYSYSFTFGVTIAEVGVLYNTTGEHDKYTKKLIFPLNYETSIMVLENTENASAFYFKPYMISCMGTVYKDIIPVILSDCIKDTDSICILDTYGQTLYDTYQ